MSVSQQEWLSQRAYALWEEGGRQDGQDAANWEQAVGDYARLEATRASTTGEEIVLMLRRQREAALPEPDSVEPDAEDSVAA